MFQAVSDGLPAAGAMPPTASVRVGHVKRVGRPGKRLLAVAVVVVLGLVVVSGAEAEGEDRGMVRVDIRIWQSVSDPSRVYLSARPEGEIWGRTERLPIDGTSERQTFHYSDRTVAVPIGDGPADVNLRVWWSVSEPPLVFIQARASGGDWERTERLRMDETNARGTFRYSDLTVTVPRLTVREQCESGMAVPEPAANAELVADCATLLGLRDTLGGSASLNWSASLAMTRWEGVTVSGTPARVTALSLGARGLAGRVPGALGDLAALTSLDLSQNFLKRSIPAELGRLERLQALHLHQNRLSGRMPFELANLRRLTSLFLAENMFGGCIPRGLRAVANNDLDRYRNKDCSVWRVCHTGIPVPDPAANQGLVDDCETLLTWRDTLEGTATLNWSAGRAMTSWTGVTIAGTPRRVTKVELANGGLTGEISGLVGELDGLTELRLDGNALTGRIPSKVATLSRLTHVYLAGNAFTGCMPPSLRAVANSDLATLGLPDCSAPVDVSYGDHTLTAGAYQVIWNEGDPPLIFEVPDGLQLELLGWVLQGPTFDPCSEEVTSGRIALGGSIGVLLGPPNIDSFIGLDVYEGDEWGRARPAEDADRLDPLFDRVVESAWIAPLSCPPSSAGQGSAGSR